MTAAPSARRGLPTKLCAVADCPTPSGTSVAMALDGLFEIEGTADGLQLDWSRVPIFVPVCRRHDQRKRATRGGGR